MRSRQIRSCNQPQGIFWWKFTTSWWFQPIGKILVKLDHFPRDRVENVWNHHLDKMFEFPPPPVPAPLERSTFFFGSERRASETTRCRAAWVTRRLAAGSSPKKGRSNSRVRGGQWCTSNNPYDGSLRNCLERLLCLISLGNFTPKTSNYCLKNRALGFPGGVFTYTCSIELNLFM